MSIYRQRDGLFWLSLFSIQNEKEKKIVLKRIKENYIDYTANWLAREMLKISGMNYNEYSWRFYRREYYACKTNRKRRIS